jgi:hypothetical protein
MQRRMLLKAAAMVLAVAPKGALAAPRLSVVKSPTCGCCTAWVQHMRAAGFHADVLEVEPAALEAYKRLWGLPEALWSCHTARVDGYIVEGHVPADDVKRLLRERPEALGLAVPGMPVGSPGMEMGDQREPYDTLLIFPDGRTRLFAHHS